MVVQFWVEMGALSDERFRSDVNIICTRRREMMSKLLQSEMETDEFSERAVEQNQRRDEWRRIKTDVRWTFIEMCNRVEHISKATTEMGLTTHTKRCDDFEGLQDHESGSRSDNDHVEMTHAIEHHKEYAHEFKQDDNTTAQTQRNQNSSQNGGVGELIPRSNQHVDTSREVINHDVTIHDGSDYGNTGTTPLEREEDNNRMTNTWCSGEHAYKNDE